MGFKTPLYEKHLREHARMVDFAGWDMPIQYVGVIEEHHAVRKDAGMFDVSHMLTVDIIGRDAKAFIQYLLANDINKLAKGKAMYSCMLNQEAGIVDDLIAYYFEDDFIRLVINAGNRTSDVKWIKKHGISFAIEIKLRDDLAIIAIQGPQSREKTNQILKDLATEEVKNLKPFAMYKKGEWMIARTGYTGEDGYEISMPHTEALAFWDALKQQGVQPCGLAARDTLRLEAGMNLYSQDMDESTTPVESALMWTVSLSGERDFIGKKALLSKKDKINEKLVGLVLLDRGVLRHDQKVLIANSDKTGIITSGTFSPTLGESIALARIPADAEEVFVEIRNKKIPAKIVQFPFVRKGEKVYKECQKNLVTH
ncbi:glycine cleavage system aminomethyltransferase GcvT [Fastidiosibacter lacustris]|uniref:glycine cleavage system aminomethyltransferase GcvT n=1 Tax=Fastidiosibacter lacustris TaxID=2056695 RepID=UPI000E3482AD|nr:glycine cleavage system aminomethyltransferase GcvT [Fastidiosibacter lacustris]